MKPDMRRFVIAGSYAQYRHYIAAEHLHQRAAPYVEKAEDLACMTEHDEIALVGTYWDNPAYQSPQYLQYQPSLPSVQVTI